MTKIRVTIDVDKADDMLSKWSHDNDSYRNGIFGCDEDGIYHMYYQSRNDILEFEDVEVVVDKMYEMCSCGHLGGENCSDLSDASVFRGHANLIEEGHGKCNQCDCKHFHWVKYCDKNGDNVSDEYLKHMYKQKMKELGVKA